MMTFKPQAYMTFLCIVDVVRSWNFSYICAQAFFNQVWYVWASVMQCPLAGGC